MKNECETCHGAKLLVERGRDLAFARRCPACQATCPHCGDSGYTFTVDENGYSLARPCTCKTLLDRIEHFNRAGIPARHADAAFARYHPRNAAQRGARSAAFKFANDFVQGQPGLLFYGPCGTGKTHLVVAIMRHLITERGIRTRFVEFFHLLAELKAGFSDNRSPAELIEPLVSVPVLALDELGKGRGTEWEQNVLDELLTRRYNAGRTTLFTSNYAPRADDAQEGLPERVGARIYSRLQEMAVAMHMPGDDYRKHLAQQR
ncbi:MAG: ATP-binding protein [Myxococcales bacterium]|nr:ATP-binding protein [Myxococcales bacterium]MCB9546515.1 ATP-binding protein [Myxococcales bacterium]